MPKIVFLSHLTQFMEKNCFHLPHYSFLYALFTSYGLGTESSITVYLDSYYIVFILQGSFSNAFLHCFIYYLSKFSISVLILVIFYYFTSKSLLLFSFSSLAFPALIFFLGLDSLHNLHSPSSFPSLPFFPCFFSRSLLFWINFYRFSFRMVSLSHSDSSRTLSYCLMLTSLF